jgi:hypothetical protein
LINKKIEPRASYGGGQKDRTKLVSMKTFSALDEALVGLHQAGSKAALRPRQHQPLRRNGDQSSTASPTIFIQWTDTTQLALGFLSSQKLSFPTTKQSTHS